MGWIDHPELLERFGLAMLIGTPLSVLAAAVLYLAVEEPARLWLLKSERAASSAYATTR